MFKLDMTIYIRLHCGLVHYIKAQVKASLKVCIGAVNDYCAEATRRSYVGELNRKGEPPIDVAGLCRQREVDTSVGFGRDRHALSHLIPSGDYLHVP